MYIQGSAMACRASNRNVDFRCAAEKEFFRNLLSDKY